MTKYLKIVLFAMIGIMFSGIAEAAITPINEAENDLKFGSRKKGELKCDNITTFSSPKSGMDCRVVTLSDNKTQCWKCDCSQKDYPYTKENCSGKLILDTSSSSCTDITTGKKYYKTCECGEGLLTAEETKKYDTYFDIGSPVQSAGNLACYDPKKFTCKNASNKITVNDITSYQHTSAKTRVKSKNEPVWYEVATNIETSNKDHNGLVMCVKKVDEFTSNVMSFQPEAKTCVETSSGTTKFLNISYHYYSGCNTTRSGCQESSHPCVEEEIVEVNGYSTSTKEAKTFSCSHISGCKIGKQGDSLCDKAPATDNSDLVYNKDNGCALISCLANYEYVGSGTGETSFNGANGDSANTNYTYVSKAPDASSDGWIVCRMENSSPIDEPTKEEEGICPDDATLTAEGVCKCNNPDKVLVTDDNGERKCEQACVTHVPDGHICTQTTVDGQICYTDCVPSICGTGYVNEGENIVYGSTGANTHKMIAVKQGGKYYNPYIHSSGNFSHDNYKSGISGEYTGLSSSVTSSLSALADYQNITFWADGGCAESSGMMWIGKNGKLECANKSNTTASHLIYLTPCTCPTGATGSLEEKTAYDAYNCKAGQYYSGSGYDCSSTSDEYLVANSINGNAIVTVKVQDLVSSGFVFTSEAFEQVRSSALNKCGPGQALSYEEYINIADKLKEIWPDAYNNNCLVVKTGEVVRTSDNTKGSGMSAASSFTSKGFDACVYNNQIRARVICKKDFLSKSTTTKYSKCTCPSGQIYDGATGECRCETGYTINSKGVCVLEKCPKYSEPDTISGECRCVTGASIKGNECVCNMDNHEFVTVNGVTSCKEKCPQGESRDKNTGECSTPISTTSCSGGMIYDSRLGCVCPDGTQWNSYSKVCAPCTNGYYNAQTNTCQSSSSTSTSTSSGNGGGGGSGNDRGMARDYESDVTTDLEDFFDF